MKRVFDVDLICEHRTDATTVPMRFRLMNDEGVYESYSISAYKPVPTHGCSSAVSLSLACNALYDSTMSPSLIILGSWQYKRPSIPNRNKGPYFLGLKYLIVLFLQNLHCSWQIFFFVQFHTKRTLCHFTIMGNADILDGNLGKSK